MPMQFTTYLTQLNDALNAENGPNLANLLRPTSPHGKDLVKEFRNPTVSCMHFPSLSKHLASEPNSLGWIPRRLVEDTRENHARNIGGTNQPDLESSVEQVRRKHAEPMGRDRHPIRPRMRAHREEALRRGVQGGISIGLVSSRPTPTMAHLNVNQRAWRIQAILPLLPRKPGLDAPGPVLYTQRLERVGARRTLCLPSVT